MDALIAVEGTIGHPTVEDYGDSTYYSALAESAFISELPGAAFAMLTVFYLTSSLAGLM